MFFDCSFIPLYFFLTITKTNCFKRQHLRIIGGRDAQPSEFPYVVRLERMDIYKKENWTLSHKNSNHHCTASVLYPTWTITAGHCIDESDNTKSFYSDAILHRNPRTKASQSHFTIYVIRYGTPAGKPLPQSSFSKVLRLEKLNGKRVTFDSSEDLILLKTEPIPLKIYAKISAVDYTALYGHEVTVAGYGQTNNTENILYYDTLQLGRPLQVVNGMLKRCSSNVMNSLTISVFPLICVVHRCASAALIYGGDSGGPVLHPSGVVALNSLGDEIYTIGDPSDYISSMILSYVTPVSPFLDWITGIVQRDEAEGINV